MAEDLDVFVHKNNLPLLNDLEMVIKIKLHAAMLRIGIQLERCAVLHINSQDLNWAPLTARWLAYKKRKGYALPVYTMTTSYLQNITHHYTPDEFKMEVGVMRSAMWINPVSGKIQPLYHIADALEYGYDSKNIPARPLWRPVLEENRRSVQTTIGIAIRQGIKTITDRAQGNPYE